MADGKKYPVISLKEFDAMMQEEDLAYSVMILLMLDEAAGYVKKAKRLDNDYWYQKLNGEAYNTQIYALQLAEYEKSCGKIAEQILPVMAMIDESFARGIYTRWRGYLARIGHQLPSFEEALSE